MFGKIIKGHGFGGTLNYLFHGNAERPKTEWEARLIGGNMVGRNARELASEFRFTRQLRPDIKRAVVHIPLSLADGESFSDREWEVVAECHLNDLGYDDNQWALIHHSDADHDHVHIVACSIRFDGTRVNDSNDYRKGALSRKAMEQEYGLKACAKTPEEAREARKHKPSPKPAAPPPQSEEAVKERLRDILKEATMYGPTMSIFIRRLEGKEVGVQANIAKTGRVSGISYVFEGHVFKGSKLGKAYAWQGLQKLSGVEYYEEHGLYNLRSATRKAAGQNDEFQPLPPETQPPVDQTSKIEPSRNEAKTPTTDKKPWQRGVSKLKKAFSTLSQSVKQKVADILDDDDTVSKTPEKPITKTDRLADALFVYQKPASHTQTGLDDCVVAQRPRYEPDEQPASSEIKITQTFLDRNGQVIENPGDEPRSFGSYLNQLSSSIKTQNGNGREDEDQDSEQQRGRSRSYGR